MKKALSGFILSVIIFVACKQKSTPGGNPSTIQSFRMSIVHNSSLSADSPAIVITEKNIRVLKGAGADSLQFIIPVKYSDTLSRISDLSPLKFDQTYSNECISGGLQLTIVFSKGDTSKTVHINNFYHPQLGMAIEFANSHVPENFRIAYNQKQLEEEYEKCKTKSIVPRRK